MIKTYLVAYLELTQREGYYINKQINISAFEE